MSTIVGTLTITGPDNLTTVSAVDLDVNGQCIYITYLDSSGNLKTAVGSIVQNVDGTRRVSMSGCSIS
jgi:hypothetical protein